MAMPLPAAEPPPMLLAGVAMTALGGAAVGLFSYLADDATAADVGCRVKVSFGRGRKVGIVVAVGEDSDLPRHQLKPVDGILRDLPAGEIRREVRSEPDKRGFGWIEGWRGDILVALETGSDGKIRRCHCHDPSWHNWPALEHAVIDNIVPDFPLINKSFNLSYAGQDL